MKTIEMSTARKPLAEYAKEFGEDIVILTDKHKPVAAVFSLKKPGSASARLSVNPKFMKIIEKARKDFARGKKQSLEDVEKELLG